MRRIGVEKTLTPVKEFLSEKGYQVELFDTNLETLIDNKGLDAYIISGMQNNMLGIQDTAFAAPIIDATGLSAEKVYQELQHRALG